MVFLGANAQTAVGASADGRLELFTVGDYGTFFHIWQTDLSDHWSSWFSHGTTGEGLASPAALAADANKQLQLFATTYSTVSVHLAQKLFGNLWQIRCRSSGIDPSILGLKRKAEELPLENVWI